MAAHLLEWLHAAADLMAGVRRMSAQSLQRLIEAGTPPVLLDLGDGGGDADRKDASANSLAFSERGHGRLVVVACASPHQRLSREAARSLRQAGVRRVRVLSGGTPRWNAWREARELRFLRRLEFLL